MFGCIIIKNIELMFGFIKKMEALKIKIKNIILLILIIIVSILTIIAVYSNRYKFTETNTIKYTQVAVNGMLKIDELAEKYSSLKNKDKFISEIIKINNLKSSDYITNKGTIIIPIIETD